MAKKRDPYELVTISGNSGRDLTDSYREEKEYGKNGNLIRYAS